MKKITQMKVSIGVVIVDADHKILLGRRQNVMGEGTWGLPGGHMKLGESIFECAKREVFHEVGIHIQNMKLIEVTEEINTSEEFQLVELGYKCNKWEGIVELKEHKYSSEWNFFALDKLPADLYNVHEPIITKIAHEYLQIEETAAVEPSLFDFVHPHFKVAVQSFVINKKGELLMGLRRDAADGGSWAVPGGHLDLGDTLEECALRELREETGLVGLNAQQFTYVEQPINLSNTHYFHFGYIINNFEDKPLINGEPEDIERWEWFPINKIPHNIAGYQRELIIRFLKLQGVNFGKK